MLKWPSNIKLFQMSIPANLFIHLRFRHHWGAIPVLLYKKHHGLQGTNKMALLLPVLRHVSLVRQTQT